MPSTVCAVILPNCEGFTFAGVSFVSLLYKPFPDVSPFHINTPENCPEVLDPPLLPLEESWGAPLIPAQETMIATTTRRRTASINFRIFVQSLTYRRWEEEFRLAVVSSCCGLYVRYPN